jgi:hypothetical protein
MPKKTKINQDDAKERVLKFFPILRKTYLEAKVSLDYQSPLELMIATILAAQCADLRINIVTKDLFKKYRKVDIHTAPFFHRMADNAGNNLPTFFGFACRADIGNKSPAAALLLEQAFPAQFIVDLQSRVLVCRQFFGQLSDTG